MALVGPGATQQDETAPTPTLEGASEYEYVTILNPLPDDFAIRVAQDIPVNMPFMPGKDLSGQVSQLTNTEQDVRQVYGLNLKNPDFKARKHVVNDTVIKAGQTINLKGNEAQVAVRQLVNEILQREGKRRLMADPHLRREVEDRIIKHRGTVQDLMDRNIQSTRSQIDQAITQSNEAQNETAFPGLTDVGQGSGSPDAAKANTPDNDNSKPKRVGQAKKADS